MCVVFAVCHDDVVVECINAVEKIGLRRSSVGPIATAYNPNKIRYSVYYVATKISKLDGPRRKYINRLRDRSRLSVQVDHQECCVNSVYLSEHANLFLSPFLFSIWLCGVKDDISATFSKCDRYAERSIIVGRRRRWVQIGERRQGCLKGSRSPRKACMSEGVHAKGYTLPWVCTRSYISNEGFYFKSRLHIVVFLWLP